jgi:glycosyltransferase involved in cell wall biosynthesis
VLHDRFIADDDVRYYFSAADCLVLPYRSATQSGVTQIAYNFSVPMLVTNVGGLPEIVPDGRVGLVCEPTVDGILQGLQRIYADGVLSQLKANFAEERKRFSWEAMCDKLLEVYHMCK